MSADTFHHNVEHEMKHLCDWEDFLTCVRNAGHVYEMKVGDFVFYESGLSQSKEFKTTRPRSEQLSVAEFRKGSTSLFFKTNHSEEDFKEAHFLKAITKKQIASGTLSFPARETARGIFATKKETIIRKLGP